MTEHKHDTEKGIATALFAFFLFSISDGLRKIQAVDHSLIDILFWQGVFALVVLLATSPLMGGIKSVATCKNIVWHLMRAVLIALNTTFSIIAVSNVPIMDAYTIYFLTPFVTTIFSMFFFGERFGIYRWMAIAFGFIGAFIAFRPGFAELHWAYGFAVACVFTFSLSSSIARKIGHINGTLSFGLWPVLALLIGIILFEGIAIPPFHNIDFLFLCFFSGGAYGLALVLIALSYTLAPASVVSPYQYVQIIFALGFGYFVFHDTPDAFKFLGAGIIVGSGVFLFLRERAVKQRKLSNAR